MTLFEDCKSFIIIPSVDKYISYIILIFILGLSADRTMQILGFRHEQATVHMRGTWSTVLARHGIEGQDDQLAPYVSRYDNVTVTLTAFGSSITLNFIVIKFRTCKTKRQSDTMHAGYDDRVH